MKSSVDPRALKYFGLNTPSKIDKNLLFWCFFQCVCIGACSTAWTNGNLPDSQFPGPTAFGFFDDLYMNAGTSQTVYYATTGTYPSRSLVFEFYTSHFGAPNQYYHFQILFYEASLNVVRYYYYQASDGGISATIGVQSELLFTWVLLNNCFLLTSGSGSGSAMTYTANQANAVPIGAAATSTPTLILTFNTNTGTYTSSG